MQKHGVTERSKWRRREKGNRHDEYPCRPLPARQTNAGKSFKARFEGQGYIADKVCKWSPIKRAPDRYKRERWVIDGGPTNVGIQELLPRLVNRHTRDNPISDKIARRRWINRGTRSFPSPVFRARVCDKLAWRIVTERDKFDCSNKY